MICMRLTRRGFHPSLHCRLIEPQKASDMPMFKHCAGGMIAVTEDFFEVEMRAVLRAHGINGLIMPDEEPGK